MKKLYFLLISTLIYTIALAQNPVPNSSVENWTGSPMNPDSWYSNNTGNNVLISQTSGYTGNFAAKGNVINFNGSNLVAPYLGCNFPVNQYYNTIRLYYTTNLDSGDAFQISAAIYDTANTFLALNYYNVVFTVPTFSPFTLDLDSVSSGTPDHALITFTIIPMSPNTTPHINSFFVIDDVELHSGTTGINENDKSTKILVFPNPAKDKLFIYSDLKENNPCQIILYDVSGKIVLQKKSAPPVNEKITDVLNIMDIASGIYMLRISGEKENYLRKVIIE